MRSKVKLKNTPSIDWDIPNLLIYKSNDFVVVGMNILNHTEKADEGIFILHSTSHLYKAGFSYGVDKDSWELFRGKIKLKNI